MTAIATYIGGPLDGQSATRPGTRWSAYRSDDGTAIDSRAGDREFRRGLRGKNPRRHYIQQLNPHGHVVYVHATVWSPTR